jgi:hypothetical protein
VLEALDYTTLLHEYPISNNYSVISIELYLQRQINRLTDREFNRYAEEGPQDLGKEKQQRTGENYMVWSFIICTIHLTRKI